MSNTCMPDSLHSSDMRSISFSAYYVIIIITDIMQFITSAGEPMSFQGKRLSLGRRSVNSRLGVLGITYLGVHFMNFLFCVCFGCFSGGLAFGGGGQWRIQEGHRGPCPPQTMVIFSHLVIQITDRFLNNETHKNCLNPVL